MTSLSPEDLAKRVAELRNFYVLKEREPAELMERCEVLLKTHTMPDIALALKGKYSMLPPGWRKFVPPSSIAISQNSSTDYSFAARLNQLKLSKGEIEDNRSVVDQRIDEIIDSEYRFVDTIEAFVESFVDPLYHVLSGGAGKDALKQVSISLEEANSVFEHLTKITKFSKSLLARLEVVSLVRKKPVDGSGRAIHVGQAFVDMEPRLNQFCPIITTYQSSLHVVKEAEERASKMRKSTEWMNFAEMWEKASSTNQVLKGQSMSAILITPMQRIPRYVLLLKELSKEADSIEAPEVVAKALALYQSAAKQIDDALKKHQKLQAFFGDAEKLTPVTSSNDGSGRIRNTYVPKLPAKFQSK